jgi:hypothetical protein
VRLPWICLRHNVINEFRERDNPNGMHMYDYVVVGAGSAGCVLAARLTEDRNVSVAVIEAGQEDTAPEIHIPTAFPTLFKSSWDWDFDSDCEPGLGGPRVYLPRGRMLGGSSSMNAMVYIRGNANDYDEWPPRVHRGGATRTSFRTSSALKTMNAAAMSTTESAAHSTSPTAAR